MIAVSDKSASSNRPLRLLLIGPREEDYFLIRDVLSRDRRTQVESLDHARSLAEIQSYLTSSSAYDLALFECESNDEMLAAAIHQLRQQGRTMPFVVLAEGTDEKALASLAGSGACEFVGRDELG